MKAANMTRTRSQVYSIGNYLMTGRVLGKGHFARVEEATHRVVGKKVAIKIIDLTLIKEEYARRNLHREPRVMARLRHPCIAALYETMMHGPRLYVVMEVAGGGDLCAYVLTARGGARGLPEARARYLAAQLVSAVRHMHDRGVVHRDLKMENIMLDSTKQFIKIVDFGLSNLWSSGGALKTPCGSLEYAAPELFLDGRRYGPEVDLWSIGVIVYGMVTGGLPFTAPETNGETRDRPLLRQIISKGFGRKQRAALACVSNDCKAFIQHLLEPNVELRMKIEEASRNRWVRKPGMRMKLHPFGNIDGKANREIYKQISEASGQTIVDIAAQIKVDPFGELAGMYNIKTHQNQLQSLPAADLLWSNAPQENRPSSPPEYKTNFAIQKEIPPTNSKQFTPILKGLQFRNDAKTHQAKEDNCDKTKNAFVESKMKNQTAQNRNPNQSVRCEIKTDWKNRDCFGPKQTCDVKLSTSEKPVALNTIIRYTRTMDDSGDGYVSGRLPSIDEHSNTCLADNLRNKQAISKLPKSILIKSPEVRRAGCSSEENRLRLNSCPVKITENKITDFYRRGGDGLPSNSIDCAYRECKKSEEAFGYRQGTLDEEFVCVYHSETPHQHGPQPSWRSSAMTPPTRILLQSNATSIKRASLGNITSPHSSTNSHCKSERAMPVGWCSRINKEVPHLQRYRRNAPTK